MSCQLLTTESVSARSVEVGQWQVRVGGFAAFIAL
jgi:hypothetical protein